MENCPQCNTKRRLTGTYCRRCGCPTGPSILTELIDKYAILVLLIIILILLGVAYAR